MFPCTESFPNWFLSHNFCIVTLACSACFILNPFDNSWVLIMVYYQVISIELLKRENHGKVKGDFHMGPIPIPVVETPLWHS